MPELSGRTENFTDSVIRRMTRVSLQYGAVNLSQGFPDFDPPKEILDRLAEVAHEDYHQYSITWGAQNFREALAEKQSKFMGRSIDPNTVFYTPEQLQQIREAKQAQQMAQQSLLQASTLAQQGEQIQNVLGG